HPVVGSRLCGRGGWPGWSRPLNTMRPRSASRGSRWRVGDNLAPATFDQGANVVGPQRQCVAHLRQILRQIVDASGTSAMSAVVVQQRLDDVRLDVERLVQAG